MCCHSLSKFLHKASKIFLNFVVIPLIIFTHFSDSGQSNRTQDHTESSFFSPSGGVDIKSNTFLFYLPLYENVLHNSLSDRTLDLIRVGLHFYVLLTENCSMGLCKNGYFQFVSVFILLHFHTRFHQSNEKYVINVSSFSL